MCQAGQGGLQVNNLEKYIFSNSFPIRDEGVKPGDMFLPSIALEDQAKEILEKEKEVLKLALLHPCLLPLILDPLPSRPTPSYPVPLLAAIGLSMAPHPLSLEQLTALLVLIFPGLRRESENFQTR